MSGLYKLFDISANPRHKKVKKLIRLLVCWHVACHKYQGYIQISQPKQARMAQWVPNQPADLAIWVQTPDVRINLWLILSFSGKLVWMNPFYSIQRVKLNMSIQLSNNRQNPVCIHNFTCNLCSLYFVTLSMIINNVIVTTCSVSLAIRQIPDKTGYLTQQWKPPRFKG